MQGRVPSVIHILVGDLVEYRKEMIRLTGLLAAFGYFVKELIFLVSYVKNNAFPQPLSASEERACLEKSPIL